MKYNYKVRRNKRGGATPPGLGPTPPGAGPLGPKPSPLGGPPGPKPSPLGGPPGPKPSPLGGPPGPKPSPLGGPPGPKPSPLGGPPGPKPSPLGGPPKIGNNNNNNNNNNSNKPGLGAINSPKNTGSKLGSSIGKGAKSILNSVNSGLNTLGKKKNNVFTGAKSIGEKGKALVGEYVKVAELGYENTLIPKILIIVIGIAILVFVSYFGVKALQSYIRQRNLSTVLLPGTKSGDHAIVISQDPNQINYNPILKSQNQSGIEFTYSLWIWIKELGGVEEQHIFHKGSNTNNGLPDICPALYLDGTQNKLIVKMSTLNNYQETLEIPDIPLKKWVCVQLVLQHIDAHTEDNDGYVDPDLQNKSHILDVYINGKNKRSMLFDHTPKQNNGNLWISKNGGFNGYLSKMKYFAKALDFEEIRGLVREGPATVQTVDTGELPPYLDDQWWHQN